MFIPGRGGTFSPGYILVIRPVGHHGTPKALDHRWQRCVGSEVQPLQTVKCWTISDPLKYVAEEKCLNVCRYSRSYVKLHFTNKSLDMRYECIYFVSWCNGRVIWCRCISKIPITLEVQITALHKNAEKYRSHRWMFLHSMNFYIPKVVRSSTTLPYNEPKVRYK